MKRQFIWATRQIRRLAGTGRVKKGQVNPDDTGN